MGVGTSLFLIAVGAVLDFAVKVRTAAFSINTVGLILMIVGVVGLILSLMFWNSWGGFGGSRRSRTVVEDRSAADAGLGTGAGYGAARQRTVVRDEQIV